MQALISTLTFEVNASKTPNRQVKVTAEDLTEEEAAAVKARKDALLAVSATSVRPCNPVTRKPYDPTTLRPRGGVPTRGGGRSPGVCLERTYCLALNLRRTLTGQRYP